MATNNQYPQLTGAKTLWAILAGKGPTTTLTNPGNTTDNALRNPTIHQVPIHHQPALIPCS